MMRIQSLAVGLLSSILITACTTAGVNPPDWSGPETTGLIEAKVINEASGLAASRRQADLYWINNDSGGEPVLYAVDSKGHYKGSVRITGATNYDWEDVASFEIDGKAYLLAADVGDNFAKRTECVLYIIAEPDPTTLSPDHEVTAPIVRQITYVYPGGARDCEDVAVDVPGRAIYVVSKRTKPPVAYRMPLVPDDESATLTAELVGDVNGIPEPTGPTALLETTWGKYRALPCGLDITPDGRTAAFVTYGEVYIYHRTEGETWAHAFARGGEQLAAHNLPQAEGVCFSTDGNSVFVVTEGSPAPLLRYTRKP